MMNILFLPYLGINLAITILRYLNWQLKEEFNIYLNLYVWGCVYR